jgi:hypothetical protein
MKVEIPGLKDFEEPEMANGVYEVQIKNATVKEGASGINYVYEITQEDAVTRSGQKLFGREGRDYLQLDLSKLSDWPGLVQANLAKIKSACQVFYYLPEGDDIDPEALAEKMINEQVRVQLSSRKDKSTGDMRQEVKKFYSL